MLTSAGEGPPSDAKNEALGALGISYKAKEAADKNILNQADGKTQSSEQGKDVVYLYGP